MNEMEENHFDWVEYAICALMLFISLMIGVYFAWWKGGQNTISEYLLGSKQMSIFPITMSLIASQISTFTLLGLPAEIYTYGTQFAAVLIPNILSGYVTLYTFLPVFYKLQLISIYEYLELRFNHSVRVVTSVLCIFSLITFLPIVMYGPALALNQVSGINVHIVTLILFSICIFYTTVGGLRAVVWTDTIQTVMMVVAVFAVLILGVIKAGGLFEIFRIAYERDRLEFFNFNPDPTERLTLWTMVMGVTVTWVGYLAVHPGSVQRFLALPTLREAKRAVLYVAYGINVFAIPSLLLGLVVFAIYKDCDPVASKKITRSDQIVPFFVLDVAGHIKGLSGVFIVGLCSASLSTVSTGLNSLAGIAYEDFIQPYLPGKQTDARASFIMKVLVVIMGSTCIFLVLLIEKLGPILDLTASFGGVTFGVIVGVFALGMMFPTANTIGAAAGGISSIIITSWIMIGRQVAQTNNQIFDPTKPVSVAGCTSNFSLPDFTLRTSTNVPYLYRVSIFYYGLIGTGLAIVIGLITSHLTGPRKLGDVHPDLLNPYVHRFLPKKEYTSLSLNSTTINRFSQDSESEAA